MLSTYFIFHAFLKIHLELSEAVLLAGLVKKDDILKDFFKRVLGFLGCLLSSLKWLPTCPYERSSFICELVFLVVSYTLSVRIVI